MAASSGPSTNTLRAHGGEGARRTSFLLGAAWSSGQPPGAPGGSRWARWLGWLQSIASGSPAAHAVQCRGQARRPQMKRQSAAWVSMQGEVRAPRALRGRFTRLGDSCAGEGMQRPAWATSAAPLYCCSAGVMKSCDLHCTRALSITLQDLHQ